MDFLYTVEGTENSDKPIMLLYGDIGVDEITGLGISGEKFTRELMFLDTLGKKSIEIWVNSGGGVITDSEQIYHAALATKTPIDTVNTGTAASCAVPIFCVGRNRTMMSHSKNMMHPVSGGDPKSLLAYTETVSKMLSIRSFLTEDKVKSLMAKTTWIDAEDSITMGLCTGIDYADKYNLKNIEKGISYKEYSKIVNKLIENKKPNMNKVTNKLKLNDSANDEAILDAIEAIENKSKFDKFLDEHKDSKDKYNALQAKYDALTAKFDAEEKKNADAKFLDTQNKAKELVQNAIKTGKITNDEKVVKNWEDQAVANFDTVKNMLEALPINKVKPTNVTDDKAAVEARKGETLTPSIDVNNTNSFVARMNGQVRNNATNRFK